MANIKTQKREELVYLLDPKGFIVRIRNPYGIIPVPLIPKKEKYAIDTILNTIGKNPWDFYCSGKIKIQNNNRIFYFDVSNIELKTLPESIENLSDLRGLLLNNNPQLTTIPKEIRNLKKLKFLVLDSTSLSKESKELSEELKQKGVSVWD